MKQIFQKRKKSENLVKHLTCGNLHFYETFFVNNDGVRTSARRESHEKESWKEKKDVSC